MGQNDENLLSRDGKLCTSVSLSLERPDNYWQF